MVMAPCSQWGTFRVALVTKALDQIFRALLHLQDHERYNKQLATCNRPHTYSDSTVQHTQSEVEVSEVHDFGGNGMSEDFVYLPCSYK